MEVGPKRRLFQVWVHSGKGAQHDVVSLRE